MKALHPIFVILLTSFVFAACESDSNTDDPIGENIINDILLYSKNPDGYNELYKLQDGVESVLISNPDYDYWWPKVSPDRSKILVYRSPTNPAKDHDDYQNSELIVANIDGSNPKILIGKNAFGWNAHGVCRWNKDGSKILMCAEVPFNGAYQWRLVMTDNLGAHPKVLSDHWAIDAYFSIDNQHIVFMGYDNNQLSFDFTKLELQRGDYDPATNLVSNVISLTVNNTRDHDPDYAPDNQHILFSAGNASYSNVDLKVLDLSSGLETTLLDDNSANGGSMCWSSDGKYVFFHSLELFKSPFRIKQLEIATGTATTLLSTNDDSHGFFHPEAYSK